MNLYFAGPAGVFYQRVVPQQSYYPITLRVNSVSFHQLQPGANFFLALASSRCCCSSSSRLSLVTTLIFRAFLQERQWRIREPSHGGANVI